MSSRGSVDAHLLSWGVWRMNPSSFFQKCSAETYSQEPFVVGGHWEPGRRCKVPFSTPKGFSFPLSLCLWPWERTDTALDTVGTALKPPRMSFSIILLTALFCNFATSSVWG